MHVDHINRIRDDNRWKNLRLLTPKDNRAHRVVTRKPPASGVTGVYWDGRKNKWVVQIFRNRKVHYGGYHSTIDAAAVAADELRATLDQQAAA
ncbi:HNH endonuclease [Pseudomonas sp. 32_A]|uniref:HNH endonuclease n=1 Tax=Pseudomonas sp. 32_A TaxID=2813559 RepID=UPI001A9F33DA